MSKLRYKLKLKRPKLCLFWSLPFLAALLGDVYIWQNGGIGFHFSDSGYLLQHYAPDQYNMVATAIDDHIYRVFLDLIFRSKTVVLGGIISLISILIINRPRREKNRSAFPRIRR